MMVKQKSRLHVRNVSTDTRFLDAGSSEDESEAQAPQAPIAKALENLQVAAADFHKKKVPRPLHLHSTIALLCSLTSSQKPKKKIARVGKKPKKTALNALLPLHFAGKKFNYRTPLEVRRLSLVDTTLTQLCSRRSLDVE